MRTKPQHRCGFTLIELLVAIGIIAILLGLLMPALTGVFFKGTYAAWAVHSRQPRNDDRCKLYVAFRDGNVFVAGQKHPQQNHFGHVLNEPGKVSRTVLKGYIFSNDTNPPVYDTTAGRWSKPAMIFDGNDFISFKRSFYGGSTELSYAVRSEDYLNAGLLTMCAWIKPTTLNTASSNHGTQNCFLAKAADVGNDNFEFGVNGGRLFVYLDAQGADQTAVFGNAGAITVGRWHFVAVRYDGDKVVAWVNDEYYEDTTTWANSGGLDDATGAPVTVGGTEHSDIYFTGMIDEIALFGDAIEDTYIQSFAKYRP